MMDPGQDLLLAALSESGISPNDLFDGDSLDIGVIAPGPVPVNQQVRVFFFFCFKCLKFF